MVAKQVEDNDNAEKTCYPRLLVMFRPPSRHTYGFQGGETYDIPLLELQTLIQDRDCKGVHINFMPVTETSQQPPPSLQKQSRNQLKKKKQKKNYNEAGTQPLYWLESSNHHLLDEVISNAVSRAILTHALFRIEYSSSFSNDVWISSLKNNEDNIHKCREEMTDVISMSNPNMSNEERSNMFQTVSILLQIHNDDALLYLQRQLSSSENRVLIYHEQSSDIITHHIHIGSRMAIGPAGTRGAPSQTLRRTHRGILKEYALKSRFGVTAGNDRSNVSTAMEPEIGFLMANLAQAGSDAGQSVLDPCCGSGSLLLYAASLGATKLVGVDSDSSVWESAKDEFKKHKRLNSNTQLTIPNFFHGDVFDPFSTECLHTANTFDAIVCDPPYNVGAPVLLAGQDVRPINYHHDDEEGKGDFGETIDNSQYDTTPSILAIARRVLVDGGRLVFFLPVRGEEIHMTLKQLLMEKGWQMTGSEEQLQIQFGSLQRFTPTFARWLVCMTKSSINELE
jgi:methylase of polypeptide subunit release factors